MSPINKKNDTALTLRSVTKSYDGQPVLSDLSLEFSSGTFYCLMAPSGNGKTTMFRLILGLEKPDSGVILFGTPAENPGNNDIKASSGTVSKSDPCRIRGMRPLISAVFQENRLLEGYTAIENLRFALGKRYSSEALTAYLLRLLPEDALNKPVCEFSGGMKRRVGIAQALLNDPEILILDEPTAGLDPGERVRFRNLLSEFAQDRIVLISTHIVSDVEYIAAENAVMKDGKIIAVDTTEGLVQQIEGKVWQGSAPAEELPRWEHRLQVVNLRNEPDGTVTLRYLAEAPQLPGSIPARPKLEDLYLWLFPEETEAVQ